MEKYTAAQLQTAAAILDSSRGENSYADGLLVYPQAQELLAAGADIVALARVKTTPTPDYPDMTYEFLFEDCWDFVAFSQAVSAGISLEVFRATYAWSQSFWTAHDNSLDVLALSRAGLAEAAGADEEADRVVTADQKRRFNLSADATNQELAAAKEKEEARRERAFWDLPATASNAEIEAARQAVFARAAQHRQ